MIGSLKEKKVEDKLFHDEYLKNIRIEFHFADTPFLFIELFIKTVDSADKRVL